MITFDGSLLTFDGTLFLDDVAFGGSLLIFDGSMFLDEVCCRLVYVLDLMIKSCV